MAVEQVNNKSLPIFLSRNNNFTNLVAFTFLCLSLIGIVNHEMWLDELQAWLIARDSSSIIDLLKNLEYEGHPGLWHLCLYLISRFTHHPISMQVFHIILATVATYILVRFAPFTKLQKIIFVFGYFPFYEYNIISRNYVLGILFSFSFCVLFKTKTKSYFLLSCLLFLLANTDLYGLIIAICLSIVLIADSIVYEDLSSLLKLRKWDITISTLIFCFGIATSIFQIIPPSDATFATGWTTDLQIQRLVKVFSIIGRTYIPIPNFFTYQFWNTSLFTVGTILTILGAISSLGVLSFALLRFSQKPIIFLLYVTGTSVMLAFMYFKYIGFLRHSGHLFILFIICLWLASYYSNSELIINFIEHLFSPHLFPTFDGFAKKLASLIKKLANYFSCHDQVVMTILYTHLFAGIFALTMDLYYPFSITKEVSRFIEKKQIDNILVIGDVDYVNYVGPSLSTYLDKKVYYLRSQKSGFDSFLTWDKNRGNIQRKATNMFFKNLEKLISIRKSKVLLILNHKLSNCRKGKQYQLTEKSRFKIEGFVDYCWQSKNYFVSKVSVFKPGIVSDENPGFYLYLIRPKQ